MQTPSRGSSGDRPEGGKGVVSYRAVEESIGAEPDSFVRESTQIEFVLSGEDKSAQTTPSPPHGKASWVSRAPRSWTLAAQWRQDVQRRRIRLLDDLNRLELTTEASRAERDYLVTDLLEDANRASTEPQRLNKWWWGTEIERAWARLREVEERTIDLLPDDELMSRVADALQHARDYITGDDERVMYLEMLRREAVKTNPPALPADLRQAIVSALRAAHAQSDRANQEARFLRNRLLIASAVIAVAAVLLVFAQWRVQATQLLATPGFSAASVPNSPGPSGALPSPAVASVAPQPSPGTWDRSNSAYLVLVMLFGSVGALFTAIPAVSKAPSDFSPFNLPLQQFLLKIVFGSLTAVMGLAIVAHTTDLLFKWPQTLPAVLLLAMLFGAAQQAVTRYVDKRAEEILTATSPKSNA